MIEYTGKLYAENMSFAIVVSRFNESINNNLLAGALDSLKRSGVKDDNISVSWVPGAYEIPLVAKTLAASKKYAAVITLGTVIRGATPHFDYVAGQVASGVSQASSETGVPVIFGVLTTENIEQALERSGTKAGNKGFDCAQAAVEMANLMKELEKSGHHVESNVKIEDVVRS